MVPDQLKLRRGLVRCGVCRHVFSGIDSLRYVAEAALPASTLPPPAESGAQAFVPASIRRSAVEQSPPVEAATGPPEPIESEPTEPEPIEPEPIEPEPIEPEPIEPEPIEPEPIEPERRARADRARADRAEPTEPEPTEPEPTEPEPTEPEPTEPEPTEPEPTEPEPIEPEPIEPEPIEPEPIEPEPEPEPIGPLRQAHVTARAADAGEPTSDETDAVDFFAPDRRGRGFASRGTAFASVAAVALAALLLLQLAIGGRDWLASRIPALGPVLGATLGPLGLRIEPPRESGALTIESFELQPGGAPSLYALSALVRNRTGHVVQWPALELSLLDGNGDIIVRKVLRPTDYLVSAPQALRQGVGRPRRAAAPGRDRSARGDAHRIQGPHRRPLTLSIPRNSR